MGKRKLDSPTASKSGKHSKVPRKESHSNVHDEMQSVDQEDSKDYSIGGYCPVKLGEIFNKRYHVIRKAGWGHFSTVWFCWDSIGQRFVALKIIKANERYSASAKDEIKILKACMKADDSHFNKRHVIEFIDKFKIKSINGEHTCMVFEALGCNLLTLIADTNYKGLPLDKVRIIIKQILQGLSYLHDSCSIIHTDIKPENIIVQMTQTELRAMAKKMMKRINKGAEADPSEVCNLPTEMISVQKKSRSTAHCELKSNKGRMNGGAGDENAKFNDVIYEVLKKLAQGNNRNDNEDVQVKIADLGNACWRDRHFSSNIQTRQYRALEVIIGAGYDISADIWSVACLAFELATGDFLFEPKSNSSSATDDDHLALICETLGPIPSKIFKRGKKWEEFFKSDGRFIRIRKLKPWSLYDVLVEKYKFQTRDARVFNDFLLGLLKYDPKERMTASEALQHKWIRKSDLTDTRKRKRSTPA